MAENIEKIIRIKLDSAQAEKALKGLSGKTKEVENSFAGLKKVAAGLGAAFSTYFSFQALSRLGKTFIKTGADVEQFKLRLVALLGSVEEANEMFEYFSDIARRVPFTLEQVIEAGVQLRAFGAEIKKWLPAVLDLAAVMGIDLPSAVSAFGMAFAGGVGAAITFRRRGILELIKSANNLRDLSTLTLEEFREAMYRAFTLPRELGGRIAGATQDLARTYKGILSMIEDAWYRFREKVAEAGLFDFVKRSLDSFRESLERMEREGTLDRLAQQISDAFVFAGKSVQSFVKILKDFRFELETLLVLRAGKKILEMGVALVNAFKPAVAFLSRIPGLIVGLALGVEIVLRSLSAVKEAVNSSREALKELEEET
ncbi:MAG: hypothetical protein DRP08_06875, partial [Candidatus Aenigmatarchaeota archaeon]